MEKEKRKFLDFRLTEGKRTKGYNGRRWFQYVVYTYAAVYPLPVYGIHPWMEKLIKSDALETIAGATIVVGAGILGKYIADRDWWWRLIKKGSKEIYTSLKRTPAKLKEELNKPVPTDISGLEKITSAGSETYKETPPI